MPRKDAPEPTIKYCLGRQSWRGSRVHHNTELWTQLIVSQWNSSGIFSQDSPHCSSATKSKSSCQKMSDQPDEFNGRIIFMSMLNDISWGSEDNEQECESDVNLVSIYAKRFPVRTLVIPLTWIRKEVVFYLWKQTTRRMGQSRWIDGDKIWRKRTPSFPCHESTVPRNGKKQRRWKIINTLLRWWGNDWNCFFAHFSVNQLSIYVAASDLCEEYKACQARTGRPVLAGQSDPVFVPTSLLTKTPTPSTGDPAQEGLLQKYQERVERLSQQNPCD